MRPSEDEQTEELLDAALFEFLRRNDSGETTDREKFLAEHADIATQLREILAAADLIEQMAGPKFSQLNPPAPFDASTGAISPVNRSPSELDFSLHSSDAIENASEKTIQFLGPHKVGSLSNPGHSDKHDSHGTILGTGPSRGERMTNSLASVTPESTQPVLPCRFGDYVLQKILGRGGMGVVYLAQQIQLERPVAIKMIRSGCFAGEEEIQRFYAEARSAARLDHPNIVAVYQCGEIDGHHYFSMDYVPGTDLARRISQGPLAPRDAARCVRDVSRTIAYAHEQGILHRDLKPANVLIDEDDQVVITDFGLAKLIGSDNGLTRSGAAVGTPSYMSPEQADGNSQAHAETTDVYSLGAILFAALTGKPPFQGTNAVQTIMDVIHKPAPLVKHLRPDVPLDLDTIVTKCLQKEPVLRYPSAAALADELDRYLNGQPIQARPLSRVRRSARWLLNVPIIAAMVGYRASDPSPAHRWTQRILIAMTLLILPFVGMGGLRWSRWWNDRSMPHQVSIAAGIPGGMYHSLAEQLASNLDSLTGKSSIVRATDGSNENQERLLNRDDDLALLQGTAIRNGRVAIIAPLYFEAMHLLARTDSSIANLDDIRNHRVAVGAKDSGTHQAVEILFENSAISFDDFDAMPMDLNALRDDPSIDAAFAVIQVGHPRIIELLEHENFHLIPIANAQTISLNDPTFRPFEITPADYHGKVSSNLQTIATLAYLTTRNDASSRLVETCLAAIYDPARPIEGLIPATRAAHWQGLPMHPAARRYFDALLLEEKSR